MERLNYKTIKQSGYQGFMLEEGTEKFIQFGEGNFLRGFADCFIDILNEKEGFSAKVAVIQPIETGRIGEINRQEGLYTLYLRGLDKGRVRNEKRVISCISRGIDPYREYEAFLELAGREDIEYILSNTTEAGIVYDESCRFEDRPPVSFPAKLTRLLYERFKISKGGKGYVILSCELIDDNGKKLKECVIKHSRAWKLDKTFEEWLEKENLFCSTLVDRIVTGYPKDAENYEEENGYRDSLLDTAEYFGLWVIEGPVSLAEKLPFAKAGLPVLVTEDHTSYKKRKVRILNGAHTAMVPVAILAGRKIVRESMENEQIGRFVKDMIYEEVIPAIDLPRQELIQFAEDVFDRFSNPFIDHQLRDIALNSISKWTARVKPSMKDYIRINGELPHRIVFALAALIAFYKTGDIRDDRAVCDFFNEAFRFKTRADLVTALLKRKDFFMEDLTLIPGLARLVTEYLCDIEEKGMKQALKEMEQ